MSADTITLELTVDDATTILDGIEILIDAVRTAAPKPPGGRAPVEVPARLLALVGKAA